MKSFNVNDYKTSAEAKAKLDELEAIIADKTVSIHERMWAELCRKDLLWRTYNLINAEEWAKTHPTA